MRVRTFSGGEVATGERWSSEIELDSTGPATRDGRLLYRVLGSAERSALAANSPADDNQFYRLSFTYRLDQAGRFQVTPMFEWSREDRAQRAATLSPSSSRITDDGRIDYTLADASPRSVNLAAGGRIDTNRLWGADVTAQFSSTWKASIGFRHGTRDYRNDAFPLNTATLHQTDPRDSFSWTVARRHTRAANTYRTTNFDASTSFELRPMQNLRSLFQFGIAGRRNANTASSSGNGTDQSPVNIYTGVAAAPLVANAPAMAPGNQTDSWTWNAYAQNQTELFRRVSVITGFSTARETSRTRSAAGVVTEPPARHGGLSPNVALVYKFNRRVSLYTSYSTSYSFGDPSYEDAAGRTGGFRPSEGENIEAGVKAAFWGNLLAASLTTFDTRANGVFVQSDPNELNPRGNRFYRQLDNGRRSRGVEAEFTVSPVPAWDTTFTYAYVDARDRGATAALPDTPAEMTPRHAISVYSRYVVLQGALQGLSARAGVIWQEERWSASRTPAAPDPLLLASFHRLDAGVAYQRGAWRIAFNVENVANAYYVLAGSTGLALSPVNPRSYALRLSRSW
jgi:iron complex outermembrane receptor protein